jgi:hypothetical protein
MLLSAKRLQGERVRARDGDAGRIDDLYFDDGDWGVRHIVVRDDRRIPEREHLVPVSAVAAPASGERLAFTLSRAQIEQCPGIESDPPVSYQFDAGRIAYYGNPTFLTWGVRAMSNPRLRSAGIVIGYGVRAHDGDSGQVSDLLIESEGWTLGALVVAPSWLSGRPTLVSAKAIERIDWPGRCVHLHIDRAQVRKPDSSLTGALQ